MSEALFGGAFGLIIGVVAIVLTIIIVAVIIVKRYRIAEPDEAIIVTGRKGKTTRDSTGREITDLSGQKVVTGGGVFVLPFVQKSFVLSLRSRRLSITTKAQTTNGITITAQAVAVIKVGGSEEMIRSAAQRFLSQQEEIESSTQEVLSGSLRGIIGQLDVQTIIRDRASLASAVLQAAEDALTKQGLVVDTLQIQEIRDDQNYIENLGRPESANVRRAAEVADTEATRAAEEARIAAERIIVDKNRELSLQKAAVQVETDKASAQAQAAKPLEDAIQRQRIVEQEEITAVKQAALREQQLNADVRKVADAEAYRITTTASADADAQVATANADKARRIAQAEALQAEGQAEATAIAAKGKAEAEAIAARAEALREQSGAVLAQQMIEALPALAKEFAGAYASIDNLTIVSADGASKLNGEMAGNIAGLSAVMKQATGIDIGALIQGRAVGEATGSAIGDNLGKAQGSRKLAPAKKAAVSTPTTQKKAALVTPPVQLVVDSEDEIRTEESVRISGLQERITEASDAIDSLSTEIFGATAESAKVLSETAHKQLEQLEQVLELLKKRDIDYNRVSQVNVAAQEINGFLTKLDSNGVDITPLLKSYPLVRGLLGYNN